MKKEGGNLLRGVTVAADRCDIRTPYQPQRHPGRTIRDKIGAFFGGVVVGILGTFMDFVLFGPRLDTRTSPPPTPPQAEHANAHTMVMWLQDENRGLRLDVERLETELAKLIGKPMTGPAKGVADE